ncbi:MAG: hypothetical protein U0835_02495 [Isosphaeraceae bacterium]
MDFAMLLARPGPTVGLKTIDETANTIMSIPEYLLLFRDGRRIRAADVSALLKGDLTTILFENRVYRLQPNDDLDFWDEWRDGSGRTIGFQFSNPRTPGFLRSNFRNDSENVTVDPSGDVTVMLVEYDDPRWECVQGFPAILFEILSAPWDCLVVIHHYSQNPLAFEVCLPDRFQ